MWSTILTAPLAQFATDVGVVAALAIGVGVSLWAPKRIWRFFKGLAS